MRISQLDDKLFLSNTGAMNSSYVVVNYQDDSTTAAVTYKTSLDILGKSIANHLNLLRNNSGDTEIYTVSNETYSTTATNINYDVAGTATNEIAKLDLNQIITNTTGKTVETINEVDGIISATFQDISILSSQISDKGSANCVATLDANGHVPSSQLPSYVDDVLEYADTEHFPVQGETGKIYVAMDTNKTYRWGTNSYVEISASLALGSTEGAAYPGNLGAAAYAHAVTNKGIAAENGLYKITTNSEGHVTVATAVEKSDITALGIPGDISGKADKVTSATNGNFAALDANGNLTDSGHKHSDYVTISQGVTNAGKFLMINSSGNIEAVSISMWEGGNY